MNLRSSTESAPKLGDGASSIGRKRSSSSSVGCSDGDGVAFAAGMRRMKMANKVVAGLAIFDVNLNQDITWARVEPHKFPASSFISYGPAGAHNCRKRVLLSARRQRRVFHPWIDAGEWQYGMVPRNSEVGPSGGFCGSPLDDRPALSAMKRFRGCGRAHQPRGELARWVWWAVVVSAAAGDSRRVIVFLSGADDHTLEPSQILLPLSPQTPLRPQSRRPLADTLSSDPRPPDGPEPTPSLLAVELRRTQTPLRPQSRRSLAVALSSDPRPPDALSPSSSAEPRLPVVESGALVSPSPMRHRKAMSRVWKIMDDVRNVMVI
ncbi:uncharacterized protein A4U43_C08F13820 [Asparagus officinalis]|nr:uncharacterized protein A4U43_C08F13820 [Asparagus officinalis]